MEKETKEILKALIKKMNYHKINQESATTQEYYFKALDKLIDGILLLRYEDDKEKEMFISINQIHERIMHNFQKINENNYEYTIIELARKITYATKEPKKYEYYRAKLEELYKIYAIDGKLDNEVTTEFYNEILNKQQNAYLSKEKKNITTELTFKLPLTTKKMESLIKSSKLKQAQELIKYQKYEELGLTEKELLEKTQELHKYLNTIKPFKNEPLTEKELIELDLLFFNAYLMDETISHYDEQKRKIILSKYSQILFPYLDNIKDTDIEINTDEIEFNYNHIRIYDKEKTTNNITQLLSKLPINKTKELLEEYDLYKSILEVLPLVSILPDFSFELYYQTIINYKKIVERLHKKGIISNPPTFNEIICNIPDIIKLTEIYNELDEYSVPILGEEVIEKIMQDNITSRNPNRYIPIYIKMLNQKFTKFPPISGEWKNYIFENNKPYDKERLLIGKNCYRSCIGPKGAGAETFEMALYSTCDDVLMIKNKETNEFVARIIMFRRGNSIIMAPIQGEKGLHNEFYNEEFLTKLGEEFLKNADKNDSLEYVLLTKKNNLDFQNLPNVMICFADGLPHADVTDMAYLLARKKRAIFVDPSVKKIKNYHKPRKPIEIVTNNINEELFHIKGIQIYQAHSDTKKEQLKQEYDQIKTTTYKKAYIGQDWYVAVREDNTLEKVTINNTKEIDKEIDSITDKLLEDVIQPKKTLKNKIYTYKKIKEK